MKMVHWMRSTGNGCVDMAELICLDCGFTWKDVLESEANEFIEKGCVHVPCYKSNTINNGRIIKRSIE